MRNTNEKNRRVMSFDSRQSLSETTHPFDMFAQIIEGNAAIVIDQVSHLPETGEGIITPANRPTTANPISALNDSHK